MFADTSACFRGNTEFVKWYIAHFEPEVNQICITWSDTMEAERKWSITDCAVASGNYYVEDLIRDLGRVNNIR
jgi:hypothetical protein